MSAALGSLRKWGRSSSSSASTRRENSASTRLQNKLNMTKTMLLKKIGTSSFEVDDLPEDYEAYKNCLKGLIGVFEELAKMVMGVKGAVDQQAVANKQLSVALSGLAAPLSQTNSTAPLGTMLLEYCKAQHEVERLRDTIVCPVCDMSRVRAEEYLVKVQEAKRLCDRSARALLELQSAHVALQSYLPADRSRSASVAAESEATPADVNHTSLLSAYKKFYEAQRKYRRCVEEAMDGMQRVVMLSEPAILQFMVDFFDAQEQFFGSAHARFQVLEERFRIRELFNEAQSTCEAMKEEEQLKATRASEKKELRKWDPMVNFLAKCAEAVLVIMPEQRDERELVNSIVVILDAYDLCYPILKDLITKEVDGTKVPSTLMRGNVYITKLLLSYMRMVCCGSAGLMLPVKPIIEEALEDPEQYEVDPKKQNKERDNSGNLACLEKLALRFVSCIIDSMSVMPFALHNILAHLRAETERKFPGKGKTFSGAFMFLRLVCPILVFPEQNNILPSNTTVTPKGRRSLMLVSKIMQNLANGVQFREEYMSSLNESFLKEQFPVITQFFDCISQIPDRSRCRAKLAEKEDVKQKELPHIYRLCFKNMEKVANQLAYKGYKEQIGELARVMAGLSQSYTG